jgi:SAM-dependent methyltransferase
MTVFGEEYAKDYDALYEDKDYSKECDLIEDIFRAYSKKPVKTILDIGCGTGGHAIELAKRGYNVLGIDRSPDMIIEARKKAEGIDNVSFIEADARKTNLGGQYDAAIMMFAVLGYQTSNDDVIETLEKIRKHLRPDGLLISDVWYGPAVLTQKPSVRLRTTDVDHVHIMRFSRGELDTQNNICRVFFKLWRIKDDTILAYTEEIHDMRYFFIPELTAFLNATDFEPIGYWEFSTEHAAAEWGPDETTWNIIFAAKAV